MEHLMNDKQEMVIDNKTEVELLKIVSTGYTKKRNVVAMLDKAAETMGLTLDDQTLARLGARISNLTGPKTVEGRLKSLANLKNGRAKKKKFKVNLDDPNLAFLIGDDERALYAKKKQEYEEDFEFNNSSDQSILSQILMVEIELFRLRKRQLEYYQNSDKDKKLTDPSDKILKKTGELQGLIKTLGADRKLRRGGKDDKGSDVASLSADFEKRKAVAQRRRQEEQEEEDIRMGQAEEDRQKELMELGVTGKGFKAKDWTSKA